MAWVTGSASGIGLASARALALDGATVVISGRRPSEIDTAIANARAVASLRRAQGEGALDALVWAHAPQPAPRPRTMADVPAQSASSRALAEALRGLGIRGVGPTTMHAAMQACGLVDEHVEGCPAPSLRAVRG